MRPFALTRHLLDLYEEQIPGRVLDGTIPALTRYILGDEIADWLEVPNLRERSSRLLHQWTMRLVAGVHHRVESSTSAVRAGFTSASR